MNVSHSTAKREGFSSIMNEHMRTASMNNSKKNASHREFTSHFKTITFSKEELSVLQNQIINESELAEGTKPKKNYSSMINSDRKPYKRLD